MAYIIPFTIEKWKSFVKANLQFATNLLGAWSTLGRVASAQTNLSFTDFNANGVRFYRLVVP